MLLSVYEEKEVMKLQLFTLTIMGFNSRDAIEYHTGQDVVYLLNFTPALQSNICVFHATSQSIKIALFVIIVNTYTKYIQNICFILRGNYTVAR